MFRQRIRWFAIGMTLLAGVIVARLLHIQMVLAADYRAISDRLLSRDARTIPAPRGDIVDRTGRVLVSDEPAWDISIKYDILAGRSEYLVGLARQWKAQGLRPKNRPERELVNELRMEVARSWQRLSELSGDSIADFVDRGEAVLQRVERIRENILRHSGVVRRLREEDAFHPIVYGIDDELALKVRLELEQNCPWIAVVPGSRRIAHDVDSLVHVLGRMGAASREQIAADPLADDEDRALRPGETCGVSGVEYAAESLLRGTRGMVAEDLAHVEIERREPIRGDSVRLSIDADLQEEVYAALAEGVQTARTGEGDSGYCSTGGAAVVLDVDTREILALVSYPAYRYDQYRSDYDELAADRIHMPLRFRAVSEQYPPGSTCKIITAVAGLQAGVITPETRIHCRGYLHENQPNAFRCWIYNQHAGATHDMINPEGQTIQDAIRYSCNIFFYQVGDRLGAESLCEWFRRFGLGSTQGTALREESPAIVPDEEYLRAAQNRGFQPSDAWNFAIGQGEVTVSPLQAAAVAATVAGGRRLPVRLILNDAPASRPAESTFEFDDRALRQVRTGMWRVVNQEGGTAYNHARLVKGEWELCGKTGSAQAMPRVISRDYTFGWPDGRREVIRAGSAEEAEQTLRRKYPTAFDRSPLVVADVAAPPAPARLIGAKVAERYPSWQPDEKLPSHAWFVGWLQSSKTPRGEKPVGRSIAISVVIEYGDAGGRKAGPVAKRIAEGLIRRGID